MLTFTDYIKQAQSNLQFLAQISTFSQPYWDWQCTVAFYAGLHLVNAHACIKENRQFNSHSALDRYLNPNNNFSSAKLPLNIYKNYAEMMNTSRISRYLSNGHGVGTSRIKAKHFTRQIVLLDSIIVWFINEYHHTNEYRQQPIQGITIHNCPPKTQAMQFITIV